MFGIYNPVLDQKGRLTFPVKLRSSFGDRFYITLWLDGCLAAFPETEWNAICEKIRNLPMAQSRSLQLYLFSNAVEVEPDAQGRVLLPQNLRDAAGIDKEVVVTGVFNHAEIWDKSRWDKQISSISADDFARTMAELGL